MPRLHRPQGGRLPGRAGARQVHAGHRGTRDVLASEMKGRSIRDLSVRTSEQVNLEQIREAGVIARMVVVALRISQRNEMPERVHYTRWIKSSIRHIHPPRGCRGQGVIRCRQGFRRKARAKPSRGSVLPGTGPTRSSPRHVPAIPNSSLISSDFFHFPLRCSSSGA